MFAGAGRRAVVVRLVRARIHELSLAIAAALFALSIGATAATAEGGSAVGWGENGFMELAAGYKDNQEEAPVASLPGVTNIVSVSAAQSTGLALLSNHTVVSWGGNIYGQLGDNSHEEIWDKAAEVRPFEPAGLSHVQVLTEESEKRLVPLSRVNAISDSKAHAYAMVEIGAEGSGNNTVYAWGNNEYGEDGQGILNPENAKGEKTMGGTSPDTAKLVEWKEGGTSHKLEHVVALAQANESNADYALVKDPTTGITTLWAWGKNDKGELGLGAAAEGGPEPCKAPEGGEIACSTYPREVKMPASVKEGATHIVQVAAGPGYAIARLDNGTVLAWGGNNAGQLGTTEVPHSGKENRRNEPALVINPETAEPLGGIKAVAAGEGSVLALPESGPVWGWGANQRGQLGEEAGQEGEAPAEECAGENVCWQTPHKISWKEGGETRHVEGVDALSEGGEYSEFLSKGKVSTTGDNVSGALGLGVGGSAETCHETKEIKEKSGTLINHFDNGKHCAGPEECLTIRESGVKWKGAWSATPIYKYGDGVEESGKKFVAVKEGYNHNIKPTEAKGKEWWSEIKELTGDKFIEDQGMACARHPYQIGGIGPVKSISAGVWHALAVLEESAPALAPLVTLTSEQEALTVKWRVARLKGEPGESRIRAGRYNPEAPGSPEYGPTLTFPFEAEAELHEKFAKEKYTNEKGEKLERPLRVEPYVVSVRTCWPKCSTENPEKNRLIKGTPLPPPPTVTSISPTSGSVAGGTSVTVHGTNLTEASEVKFGSVAASKLTVVSAEVIVAESPKAEAAGTVHVTVTTRGGTSATGVGDEFTYF